MKVREIEFRTLDEAVLHRIELGMDPDTREVTGGATMNDSRDDEPIGEFDQTNGEAPGLEGDDDGALTGDDREEHGVLTDLVRDVATDFHDRDADESTDAETPYSEEGRP
ncbi:hypothetical protein G3T36_02275 [Diaminobutyricibacter tongyongensis]|uniref:Uncharacterized protein n=1 Tax=Leifsonia tongyongensis TaxID=1268043 RepID=A0A6L9XTV2_9MICO|nr:hypothetical protein [Diaminobutyricibacter tongyongensis]NEN04687.1 hypothetical protein [Diaminobutyricibacter tongyongensis]